jgi:hypothetical protein
MEVFSIVSYMPFAPLTLSPWDQDDHPVSQETTTVMLPRPGASNSEPEVAEQMTATYHQSRKRTRHEGEETVMEEQDLVFTERRVIWRSKVKVEDGSGVDDA